MSFMGKETGSADPPTGGPRRTGRIHQMVDGRPSGMVSLDKPLFRIGRGAENDLQLSDAAVSSRHAQIETEGGGEDPPVYRIRDLGSTNGTFVNGERVESRILSDGDVIRVGVSSFRFHLGGPEDPDRTKVIRKTWIPGLVYMK